MHKTDRRIARSKEALKSTLLSLMQKKAFTSISITEIVEHANYNRGTFYAHYEDKEALLHDITNDAITDLIEAFRSPYKTADAFRVDELSANSVKLFDHIYQNSLLYSVLLNANTNTGSDFREKMFRILKKVTMEDLEVSMDIQHPHGLNRELQVIYSIHALLGLVFHWVQGGFKYSPDYMKEQLILILNWSPSTVFNHKVEHV